MEMVESVSRCGVRMRFRSGKARHQVLGVAGSSVKRSYIPTCTLGLHHDRGERDVDREWEKKCNIKIINGPNSRKSRGLNRFSPVSIVP
jgi:hypothetical protein